MKSFLDFSFSNQTTSFHGWKKGNFNENWLLSIAASFFLFIKIYFDLNNEYRMFV